MENKIQEYQENVFESIKHIDENNEEYWEARELMIALEYSKWGNFRKVINKAKITCDISNNKVSEHFADVEKVLIVGNNAKMDVEDYKLSRYACYLIVQNADPRKKEVALGQTYFAIQTRKMELTEEEFLNLSEDQRRIYMRRDVANKNLWLFKSAKEAGVKNYGKFNNAGYKGLYNGENATDIAKRKEIKGNADILDYMGSEELGANLFRITQTDAKLKRDMVSNENAACNTHYVVGKTVRNTIKELGGTMPEELPTPEKSIIELEKEELKRINGGCLGYSLVLFFILA